MSVEYSEDLAGLADDAFVRRAYLMLLGRAADASGTHDYLARLGSGVSRRQVWGEIATSEEAQRHFAARTQAVRQGTGSRGRIASVDDLLSLDGVPFIAEAYRQILGRDADAAGLREYGARLATGGAKEQVLADLRCDPEGQAFASPLPGLDDLVRDVQSGLKGRSRGAANHPGSLEELLALEGAEFVDAAYRMLFARPADAGGLGRYVPLLLQGFSKLFVLDALYASPEAKEKAARMPALEPRLRAYRRAQAPGWGGWYWRHVRGVESDLPRDREVRAVLARLSSQ
jgi:hypothetical protein